MKGRRGNAKRRCGSGRRKIGVTLQADKPNLMAYQHPRIGRSVRLMARRAAFETHWWMLECERSTLVAVTREAARIVSAEIPQRCISDAPVRVVTIDT